MQKSSSILECIYLREAFQIKKQGTLHGVGGGGGGEGLEEFQSKFQMISRSEK